jgi:prevent-host-death family protein
MSTINAIDAGAHFADLLGRVARGEEVAITANGRTVARLIPADQEPEGEDADERPWRGLFVAQSPPAADRVPAFFRPLPTDAIPRHEVPVSMGWHRADADDDS